MGDCHADDDGNEAVPIPDEAPSAAAEAELPRADVEPLEELCRRSAALRQSVYAHMKELGKQ
ncbi:hypothetical protein [Streptomyces lonarensis]|uniref:Uncharacterized protein n=1 Tax=Streptomyces lonarensis TaxID=700599 RepID=A0A7X6HZ69_9ACTN|nr:hypothetical protein [Streptomyces lonarensis]NJQ06346.1 hypothetical protein [Streptomyces lonarensis]